MTQEQFQKTSEIESTIKSLNTLIHEGHKIGIATTLNLDGPQFGHVKNNVAASFRFHEKEIVPPASFD